MTRIWRIDKAARSKEESFSGEGARLYAGRWNLKGTSVVYASQCLALAALERFVHAWPEGRRLKLVFYRIEVPDNTMERQDIDSLPPNWRRNPPPESTMEIGSKWAKGMRSAVLQVPSAIIRSEANYIINPQHPDLKALNISDAEPFAFDQRMWKEIKK